MIFGEGDEIMSGMTAFAQRERLVAAHFTAIGAIESGLFGWFDKHRRCTVTCPSTSKPRLHPSSATSGLLTASPPFTSMRS